jgi:hypothetical protein
LLFTFSFLSKPATVKDSDIVGRILGLLTALKIRLFKKADKDRKKCQVSRYLQILPENAMLDEAMIMCCFIEINSMKCDFIMMW